MTAANSTAGLRTTMNLNTIPCVRMTSSRAKELFRSHQPILAVELTERHLDMLQMIEIDFETRALLGDASDDLESGQMHTAAVRAVVAAFNARCGR